MEASLFILLSQLDRSKLLTKGGRGSKAKWWQLLTRENAKAGDKCFRFRRLLCPTSGKFIKNCSISFPLILLLELGQSENLNTY